MQRDMTPPCKDFASRKSFLVANLAGLLFLVGVSFARAGYRKQFVTEIRAGPFYRRNNYFEARLVRVGVVIFFLAAVGRFVCSECILNLRRHDLTISVKVRNYVSPR